MSRKDSELEGGDLEPDAGLNRLTEAVIGAAIEVHRELGPGLMESFYEQALCMELDARAIEFARQVAVPVLYKGASIGQGRMDLVVDGRLLVELKATEGHTPLHLAQVLSYLKTSQLKVGLLINFNVPSLVHGLKRVVRTTRPPTAASPEPPSNARRRAAERATPKNSAPPRLRGSLQRPFRTARPAPNLCASASPRLTSERASRVERPNPQDSAPRRLGGSRQRASRVERPNPETLRLGVSAAHVRESEPRRAPQRPQDLCASASRRLSPDARSWKAYSAPRRWRGPRTSR